MVTVIVAEVSPNLLSLTRHAGLILAGIPVEESESESRSKKIQMDLRTPFSPYYHIDILPYQLNVLALGSQLEIFRVFKKLLGTTNKFFGMWGAMSFEDR